MLRIAEVPFPVGGTALRRLRVAEKVSEQRVPVQLLAELCGERAFLGSIGQPHGVEHRGQQIDVAGVGIDDRSGGRWPACAALAPPASA